MSNYAVRYDRVPRASNRADSCGYLVHAPSRGSLSPYYQPVVTSTYHHGSMPYFSVPSGTISENYGRTMYSPNSNQPLITPQHINMMDQRTRMTYDSGGTYHSLNKR